MCKPFPKRRAHTRNAREHIYCMRPKRKKAAVVKSSGAPSPHVLQCQITTMYKNVNFHDVVNNASFPASTYGQRVMSVAGLERVGGKFKSQSVSLAIFKGNYECTFVSTFPINFALITSTGSSIKTARPTK